jgi:magnesium chelatase subunit H
MRDDGYIPGYRVVIVTLDAHARAPPRASRRRSRGFPGLTVEVLAAAEWAENPAALARAKDAVRHADIVVANLLFLEEHIAAILPALTGPRPHCDALVGVIADPDRQPDEDGRSRHGQARLGRMAILKKLKPKTKPGAKGSGEKQMKMLRRLPQDPALHPRQGAGPARLVPVDAVLARRVGRQRRTR